MFVERADCAVSVAAYGPIRQVLFVVAILTGLGTMLALSR